MSRSARIGDNHGERKRYVYRVCPETARCVSDHREEIDGYVEQQRVDYEAKRQAARDADPMFYQKMAEARRQLLTAP